MRGKTEKFGRCSCPGQYHSDCEVTREIRSNKINRTQEQKEWKTHVRESLIGKNDATE